MSIISFGKHFNVKNNPKLVVLNNIQLPWDTKISLENEKEIVISKILDGAYVFERIMIKAAEINIECNAVELANNIDPTFIQKYIDYGQVTLQEKQNNSATYVTLKEQITNSPFLEFPQLQLRNMYDNIFKINSSIPILSTQLNDIGINELVVKKISFNPRIGSQVVEVRFHCYENFVGTNNFGTSLFVKT